MNNAKDGAYNTPRAVDLKAYDPHYVMPEATKGDLENLFDAIGIVGMLTESCAHDHGAMIGTPDMSALHRSLAALGKRLMSELSLVSAPTPVPASR